MTSIPSQYSSAPRSQSWRQSIGSPRSHRYSEASDGGSISDHIPPYESSTVYRDEKYSPVSQLKPAKDGSWRRDSPMEYKDEPQSWTSRANGGVTTSSRPLPNAYEQENGNSNDWEIPYDISHNSTVQTTPAWATSGNAPSPRRIMNFSRPMRNGEASASSRLGDAGRDSTRPSASNTTDEDLERRLKALDMRSRPRSRDSDNTPQSHPQPSVYSPRGKGRQSGRAYSRPTLSPIPSMASATTLSTLRRHREEEDAEEHEADDETHTPHDDDALPNDYMPRRSLSASSSTTSFASQVAPVPLSHYPAASPLAETAPNQSMPSSELFPTYPSYPSTRPPQPPAGRSHQVEPSTSSTSTSNTSNTNPNTVYMNNGRSSSSNPPSSHTSATTSSQPSVDIDRIAPIPGPMPSPASITKSNLSLNLNHTTSTNSNSGSQSRVRPMRTHSTTSSGATSAMEAFKASNYDISSLTDSQIAKLKKKGIDPQLYMEMRAATGGMGKDGKKRSKWSRALVGNTFIG